MRLIDGDELVVKLQECKKQLRQELSECKKDPNSYIENMDATILNLIKGIIIAENHIKFAPVIEPEPKQGKWKYYNYSDLSNPYCGYYECTVCKQHEHTKHKYCPNCGAKMDKEEIYD